MVGECLFEGLVHLHSVGNLVLKSLLVLLGGVVHDLVVEEVELDVSGVDGERVLSLNLPLVQVEGLLNHLLTGGSEDVPEIGLGLLEAGLEVSDDLVGPVELSPLENVGLVGQLLNVIVLVLKSLDVHLGLLGILKPVDGEEVSEAGSDRLSVDLVIGGAVSSPGALLGVGGGHSVDVEVVLEDVLEHGAGLAGLDVDDHLLVHLVGVHVLEGLVQLVSVEVSSGGHGNESGGSVVSEVEEDLGVLVGVEHLSSSSLGVSLENSEDVGGGNIFALVVDAASLIDIGALDSSLGGLVEELSGEGVHGGVGDIIVGEVDDLVLGDAVLLENLEGVAGVSLMSVVVESVGSSNNDGPVVGVSGLGGGGHSGKSDVFLEHFKLI
mmetsp:Transcript_17551/g.29617  ORF Transcript_17551/g.29617 Transcript_17551/m.29617 type:complete len:380 (+) Transcript_17551:298-1437(+)